MEEEVHMGNNSRKKRKVVFPYGNYHRYYGYRVGKTLKQDPRMESMQTQWFQDKDVLDIGCNEGHVTIALAQKYHVQSMCGVDIDSGLIFRAGKNLQTESGVQGAEVVLKSRDWSEYINENGTENDEDESFDPVAMENEVESVATESLRSLTGKELLERVQFKNVNFLHCSWRSHICDTVLCLSVAKWIHLNWGDEGLIQLFVKIYRLLRPGGVLILEPQPWKSYEKKKWVTEVARENFRNIVIRPDLFSALLLDKIGFKSCAQITQDVPDCSAGFSRPLFLYTK
ncbi:unnamed protein product [Sphagnum compactum]